MTTLTLTQTSISKVLRGANLRISFILPGRPALKLHGSVQVSGGQERSYEKGGAVLEASLTPFSILLIGL